MDGVTVITDFEATFGARVQAQTVGAGPEVSGPCSIRPIPDSSRMRLVIFTEPGTSVTIDFDPRNVLTKPGRWDLASGDGTRWAIRKA